MMNTLLSTHMMSSVSVTSVRDTQIFCCCLFLGAWLRGRGQEVPQAVPASRRCSQRPAVVSRSSSTRCLWLTGLKGPSPTGHSRDEAPVLSPWAQERCWRSRQEGWVLAALSTRSAGKPLHWEASLAAERALHLTEIRREVTTEHERGKQQGEWWGFDSSLYIGPEEFIFPLCLSPCINEWSALGSLRQHPDCCSELCLLLKGRK